MIASNYRRFPEAMALQLVLVFGRPVWNTTRPSSRMGRALRYAQAALVKATPQLVKWRKKPAPAWFLAARRAAKQLAAQVRQACEVFVWDQEEAPSVEAPWPGRDWEKIVRDDYEAKTGLDWHTRKPFKKPDDWYTTRPHRQSSPTLREKWLSKYCRWVHMGLDRFAWGVMYAGGYREYSAQ